MLQMNKARPGAGSAVRCRREWPWFDWLGRRPLPSADRCGPGTAEGAVECGLPLIRHAHARPYRERTRAPPVRSRAIGSSLLDAHSYDIPQCRKQTNRQCAQRDGNRPPNLRSSVHKGIRAAWPILERHRRSTVRPHHPGTDGRRLGLVMQARRRPARASMGHDRMWAPDVGAGCRRFADGTRTMERPVPVVRTCLVLVATGAEIARGQRAASAGRDDRAPERR